MHTALAFFTGTPGIWEILIIMAVALLIFGRRLPEVGKSLGKGIVEFKKGLSGIEDQINDAGTSPGPSDRKLSEGQSGDTVADRSRESTAEKSESDT